MLESVRLNVICGSRAEPAVLDLAEDRPAPGGVSIRLHWRGEEAEFVAGDFWSALTDLRLRLESRGCLIACHGSDEDLAMSGMSREMSLGCVGQRVRIGEAARHADSVYIFGTDPPVAPVTVQAQQQFIARWRASVKRLKSFP